MTARFADTFFFFALGNPDDPAHERARDFAARDAGPLVTTAWVLTELADGLAAPPNRPAFLSLLRSLRNDAAFEIVPPDPELFDRGLDLARRVRALATATRRRFEDVVLDWLRRAAEEPPVEALPDVERLALCDSTLDPDDQDALSELLAGHREGTLSAEEKKSLDALMDAYRRGLVLKARALNAAVGRGLRPPLSEDAA